MPNNRKWILRNEAAAILKVTPQTISNYAERGLIQTRTTNRYPLFYAPDVKALAVDDGYKRNAELQKKIEQMRHQLQNEYHSMALELDRRKALFYDTFQNMAGNDINAPHIIARALRLLRDIVENAEISQRDKTILLGVVDLKPAKKILEGIGVQTRNFTAYLSPAYRRLRTYYQNKEQQYRAAIAFANELTAKNKRLEAENETLRKKVKDEEFVDALTKAGDLNNKTDYILAHFPPFNLRLTDLGVSIRALNCTRAADIETLGQLAVKTRQEIFKMRNFGRKSLIELENLLTRFNLSFGMSPEDIKAYNLVPMLHAVDETAKSKS